MWMVPPVVLCNKHLLGEHGEIHKHRHNFVKKHNISGRIFPVVQIEPSNMGVRHDQLVIEMKRRKMNHNSLYDQPDISYLPNSQRSALVDRNNSLMDLMDRCDDCRDRIKNYLFNGE